jgi:hypothetical protein
MANEFQSDMRTTSMAWLYLIIAGIFEWGWPVGLKLGLADTGMR